MPPIDLAALPRPTSRRPAAALVALLVAGTVAVLPGATHAQPAEPPLGHHDVTATCAVGRVDLVGTQHQRLDAGSTVVVVDTVTEGGTTRELARTSLSIPVAVTGAVVVDEPVRFRATTDTAQLRFERTTSVHRGPEQGDANLVHRELLTVDCAGPGAGSVTVTSSTPVPPTIPPAPTTPTTAAPSPTPFGDSDAGTDTPAPAPARPVRTTPRYTA